MSEPLKSEQSSPESYDDDSAAHPEHWLVNSSHPSDEHASSSLEGNLDGNDPSPNQPATALSSMQKRRRVTRACDECRRKKIKCDGKQPCTHCTVYSYDCTYDQPSNRRRNPTPQYVESLEIRLQRAETILRSILPEAEFKKLDLGPLTSRFARPLDVANGKSQDGSPQQGLMRADSQDAPDDRDREHEAMLESMVEATGQLDLDEQGYWDFHGHSSGYTFLRRMRQQFGDIFGPPNRATPFTQTKPVTKIFDSPKSSYDSPADTPDLLGVDLPPKEVARELVRNALDDACALMRFVHQPSFYEQLDRIYDLPPAQRTPQGGPFLVLLYVVLAVGSLFAKTEQSELEQHGYADAIDRGFRYFKASRQRMDVTDCRDLVSLQAVVFMIIFQQSSSRLSTCYAYIGLAMRSALRMGLHRSIGSIGCHFNPVDSEVRKRLFWMIRKMDTYVGAQLGLPTLLSDEDIDQELPLEVDDEYITTEGVRPMPEGRISPIAAANAHTRMTNILAKAIKYVYPAKHLAHGVQGKTSATYLVSQARIREVEQDLQQWMDELPMPFRTGGDASPQFARIQQLLRMSYAHVQMVLYRPFLHYVSQRGAAKTVDTRCYACAAACVSVSRNIVHITSEMKRRGMLNGAYWFNMYTTFFAILSLAYFVLENPENAGSNDILKDAREGRETLLSLSKSSMAADRCTITLKTLFDRIPERLQRSRTHPAPTNKKRHAPSPNTAGSQSPYHALEPVKLFEGSPKLLSRAQTMPLYLSDSVSAQTSAPTDIATPDTDKQDVLKGSQDAFFAKGMVAGPPFDLSLSSIISAQPPSSDLAQPMILQPGLGDANLPELNAMMFPSADPLVYPNQPITTLENRQSNQDSLDEMLGNNAFISNCGNEGLYDQLEGNMYGPVPSGFSQGRPLSSASVPQFGNTGVEGGGNTSDQIFAQTERPGSTQGVNLEDIFGNEEWSTMGMDPTFGL